MKIDTEDLEYNSLFEDNEDLFVPVEKSFNISGQSLLNTIPDYGYSIVENCNNNIVKGIDPVLEKLINEMIEKALIKYGVVKQKDKEFEW